MLLYSCENSFVVCASGIWPSSISQATGAESQARMKRIAQIEAALEHLTHHTSTLSQQIEQYQHSYRKATEDQGKMKWETGFPYLVLFQACYLNATLNDPLKCNEIIQSI